MQRQRVEALGLQQRDQLVAFRLGVAEGQRAGRAEVVQGHRHSLVAVGARDLVEALADGALRRGVGDADALRRAKEALGQLLDALGVGGREQQRLPLRGAVARHLHDVVMEAHVQHAVGFVQHQDGQGVERQIPALQVVQDAPRRAHHDVRAMLQRGALAAQRHAAAQRDQLDVVLGPRQAADLGAHLVRQLARGAQHHGLHREAPRIQPLQQGQPEGHRLAAAGAGLRDQVLARQCRRQALGLDRRHLQVTQLAQVVQRGGLQPEAGEVLRDVAHTLVIATVLVLR